MKTEALLKEGQAEREKRIESSPLVAALRAELRVLVEGAITPRSLTSIESLVSAAREVLAALEPEFSLGKRRRRGGVMYTNPMFENEEENSETYGSRMARELVSSLSALNKPQPSDALNVVTAIKYARENNMPDVATKLEAQLAPVQAQVVPVAGEGEKT